MSSQRLADVKACVLNSNPPWLSHPLPDLHVSLRTLSRDELRTVASRISPVFSAGKHYDKLSCINLGQRRRTRDWEWRAVSVDVKFDPHLRSQENSITLFLRTGISCMYLLEQDVFVRLFVYNHKRVGDWRMAPLRWQSSPKHLPFPELANLLVCRLLSSRKKFIQTLSYYLITVLKIQIHLRSGMNDIEAKVPKP